MMEPSTRAFFMRQIALGQRNDAQTMAKLIVAHICDAIYLGGIGRLTAEEQFIKDVWRYRDAIMAFLRNNPLEAYIFLRHGLICQFMPDEVHTFKLCMTLPEAWHMPPTHRCHRCIAVSADPGGLVEWLSLHAKPSRRIWSFHRFHNPGSHTNLGHFGRALRQVAEKAAPHHVAALCILAAAFAEGYVAGIKIIRLGDKPLIRYANIPEMHFWHIMAGLGDDIRLLIGAMVVANSRPHGSWRKLQVVPPKEWRDTLYGVFNDIRQSGRDEWAV